MKLLLVTLGLLFLIKLFALFQNQKEGLALPRGAGWLLFLFAWPGLRPERFQKRQILTEPVGREFTQGFIFLVVGLLLQILIASFWASLPGPLALYAGLFSFLLVIHFGISSLLFSLYRILGWPVEPLFQKPWQSESLRDFWSKRWNLAFVDLNKRLLWPRLPQNLPPWLKAFLIFLGSGILHEVGISYPAQAGYGLPLTYFLLHGSLTAIEPHLFRVISSVLLRRLWVWAALILPLPLLFHHAFLAAFIQPYFETLHTLEVSTGVEKILKMAIILSGFGHLMVLVASAQVPGKLNWREDFSRLSRFNQKIFWTYGGYIVFCILSFAAVDLLNTGGLITLGSSSLGIALFIALFWSARVITDFSYFKHDDWPKGDLFVMGHTCLTALFCTLALTHWSLVLWQLHH